MSWGMTQQGECSCVLDCCWGMWFSFNQLFLFLPQACVIWFFLLSAHVIFSIKIVFCKMHTYAFHTASHSTLRMVHRVHKPQSTVCGPQ